jgi:hypothetical protein
MSDHDYIDRPLVYVAGYYTANPSHGLSNAAEGWEALLYYGALPVVPHVNILLDAIYPKSPEFWYAYDLGILEHCDAMYVCEDETTWRSTGVQNEIRFAEQNGIPVLYDIPTLKKWVSGFTRNRCGAFDGQCGCDCG